jgi:hypothetical protein
VVTSSLNGLHAIGAGTAVIGGIAAGLSSVAAWLGYRVGHSPDLEHDPVIETSD